MAKVGINYTCGCGFHTRDEDKASKHCDDTNHTMTVYGTMAPDVSRHEQKRAEQKQAEKVAQATAGGASSREIDSLRKKFITRR